MKKTKTLFVIGSALLAMSACDRGADARHIAIPDDFRCAAG